MGRKSTTSYEIKVSAIETYENNVGSISMIAKMFNIKETSLKRWIANYKSQVTEGLITKHKNTQRTKEFKILAVEEYLSGNFSLKSIFIITITTVIKINSVVCRQWSITRKWGAYHKIFVIYTVYLTRRGSKQNSRFHSILRVLFIWS